MTEQAPDAAARARLAKILKIMGVFDIMLGIGAALAGPVWVPGMDLMWWIIGGVMAVAGLGLMLYGRAVQNSLHAENRTVVR